MTSPNSSIESCPACGSQDIRHLASRAAWICNSCSFAIDESDSDIPPPDVEPDTGGDSNTRWSESLSVKDKSEANLVDVLDRVGALSEDLEVDAETQNRAADIVVEAWKSNFMHGRTKEDTVGAAMYAASRELRVAIPPEFIAAEIDSDRQSVKSTYGHLKSELDLDIGPPYPTEYVGQICKQSGLESSIEQMALEMLSGRVSGGNPVGVAAAGVYLAANQEEYDITLRTLSDEVGLTKETIWRHSTNIRESNSSKG